MGEEQVKEGDHVFGHVEYRCLLGIQEVILGRQLDISQEFRGVVYKATGLVEIDHLEM